MASGPPTTSGPPTSGGFPTSVPAIPAGIDVHANEGPRVVGTMIALMVLSTGFVGLRLVSRRVARAGLWWDDALIVLACIFSLAPAICTIIEVKHVGLGRHIYVFGARKAMDVVAGFFRILYPFQFFFALSTGTIKLATLAFYRRIFPIAGLRPAFLVLGCAVVVYMITSCCLALFQCTPMHKFWDFDVPGHCISGLGILIGTGCVNTVLDFVIVLLPVPYLWRLRTSTQQKCILTGIFVTAGFVCVVSIIRMLRFSGTGEADVTWAFTPPLTWSAIEPVVGVLGACLPSLRPLCTFIASTDAYRLIITPVASTQSSNYNTASTPSRATNPKAQQQQDQDSGDGAWMKMKEPQTGVYESRDPWTLNEVAISGPEVLGVDHSMRRGGDDAALPKPKPKPKPGVIQVQTEISWQSRSVIEYQSRLF